MATILFVWELGGGAGHVAPYLNIIRSLVDRGHRVSFVVNDLSRAEAQFGGTGATYLQSPERNYPLHRLHRPVYSYPQLLHNNGFQDVDGLAGLLRAWRALFELASPDLLVFDHSPTAMLASRGMDCRRMAIGTGFVIPPQGTPVPVMKTPLNGQPELEKLQAVEAHVLGQANQAAAQVGLSALDNLAALFDVDERVLTAFRELDHYSNRGEARYWGSIPGPTGEIPAWPEVPGKRIFAYLKPFKTLPALLARLNELALPTLIYGDGLLPALKKKYASRTLYFVQRPLDMATVGRQAALALTNANHGTVNSLLLSGTPMLMLPLYLEQLLLAARVEQLGAGLCAPKLIPDGMSMKLDTLLSSPEFSRAAGAFAARYRDFDAQVQLAAIVDRIESLL